MDEGARGQVDAPRRQWQEPMTGGVMGSGISPFPRVKSNGVPLSLLESNFVPSRRVPT